MVAQAIFPIRDGGGFKLENAPRGSNDLFQTLLREYGARDLAPRDDIARFDRSRDRVARDVERVERDVERVATAWRDFDESREVRAEDRYNTSRNERPEVADNPKTEEIVRRDTPDDTQSGAERPSRDAEPATAKPDTQGHEDVPHDAKAPLENGPVSAEAPKLATPAIAANPALAANPVLAANPAPGAPSTTQIADSVTAAAPAAIGKVIPANPVDNLNTAPRPAPIPGVEAAAPVLNETGKAATAPPAAAKALQNILPAVSAEAGIPLTTVQVKRPIGSGQKAGAAAVSGEALKSAGTADKESLIPDAPRPRTDRAGLKTAASAPAPVMDTAAQAAAKPTARANPVPAPPSLETPGHGTPVAGDTAAGLIKPAAPAGNAGQAAAVPAAIDPMPSAARAAAVSPGTAPATDRPVPANEVAVHIQRAVAKGENRIRIQLHPAELGQVDVRLKIGADGIVRAMVHVERPETLDLMQRDARGLERALQDAGLKTDSGSLSFNLRDNGENAPRDGDDGDTPLDGREQSDAKMLAAGETETPIPTGGSSRALDIRV